MNIDPETVWNVGTGLFNLAASAKTLSLFDISAKERIGVAKLTPVIYSGEVGGGSGEYHASAKPDAPEQHIVDIEIPKGHRILSAWYAPLHNIAAIAAFSMIDIERHNDTQVKLSVASYPGISNRMRIAVYVLYAK